MEDLIGKDNVVYRFVSDPEEHTLLGSSFEIYSNMEMKDFIITNILMEDSDIRNRTVRFRYGKLQRYKVLMTIMSFSVIKVKSVNRLAMRFRFCWRGESGNTFWNSMKIIMQVIEIGYSYKSCPKLQHDVTY